MDTKEMMNIALKLAGLGEMPFDSAISVEGEGIKRVLAGIDMKEPEILAAHLMGYDCVARHHHVEPKTVDLGEMVYHDHFEKMLRHGVPINIAQKSLEESQEAIPHELHPANFGGPIALAKLLNMPYIGIHTPADLLVERTIEAHMEALLEANPRATCQDAIDELRTIREFAESPQGPLIYVGKPDSHVGKYVVFEAGGLAPTLPEYKAYIDAGYGTFIVMHMTATVEKALREDGRCNVIVTGHMPSDSLGFNQILDAWEAAGLEVTRIGGLV